MCRGTHIASITYIESDMPKKISTSSYFYLSTQLFIRLEYRQSVFRPPPPPTHKRICSEDERGNIRGRFFWLSVAKIYFRRFLKFLYILKLLLYYFWLYFNKSLNFRLMYTHKCCCEISWYYKIFSCIELLLSLDIYRNEEQRILKINSNREIKNFWYDCIKYRQFYVHVGVSFIHKISL